MQLRRGFTILEILMAVVILAVVVTGFAGFAGSFARSMGDASVRVIATGVVTDRLELIRADPRYDRLRQLYGAGAAGADTTGFPGFPTMRRLTTVVRDTSGTPGAQRDRTVVTVRVIAPPALKDTVAVTAVIASP